MKFAVPSLLLLLSSPIVTGFVPNAGSYNRWRICSIAKAVSDDQAQAMMDYMAKAHEAKLEAIKQVEDKKNAEIEALKKELEQLKRQQRAPPPPQPMVPGSMKELNSKLVAYQQFMSKYIVDAQRQKVEAIKAAELAAEKKYKSAASVQPEPAQAKTTPPPTQAKAPPPPLRSAATTKENKLYTIRNERVAKEGGNGRWGAQEVKRAAAETTSVIPKPADIVPSNLGLTKTQPPPKNGMPAVLEPNNGILLKSVPKANGKKDPSVSVKKKPEAAPTLSMAHQLYLKRSEAVSRAGKNSRWGDQEVQRAAQAAVPQAQQQKPIVVTPEIEAADHGMRADGGVLGPTLAERVNLGAQLVKGQKQLHPDFKLPQTK